jgi:hypothetical protein
MAGHALGWVWPESAWNRPKTGLVSFAACWVCIGFQKSVILNPYAIDVTPALDPLMVGRR